MPGFTSPGVLFAGNSASSDRRFYKPLLAALRKRQDGPYTRYVELGVGAFAASLVAESAGWQPHHMETSDVTLYSSIIGTMLAGGDLAALDVRVDGEPVGDLPASPVQAAAYLLWLQLLTRMEAKQHIPYWADLAEDLRSFADTHRKLIEKSLAGMAQRLGGISYQPMDMWDHLKLAVDDENAVVLAAPPSYLSGFEKFFDTAGRMTWAEPSYQVFDPATDMQRLMDEFTGKPALLVFLQEAQSGHAVSPKPLYARQMGPGWTAYVVSNRPDEVFGITGGPKVALRQSTDILPADVPPMPLDYEVTAKSRLEVRPIPPQVADYYRTMWMHRLQAKEGSFSSRNLLVLVDGKAAGVIGLSVDTIVRPYSMQSKWERYLLLRFAIGCPHNSLRFTRLATLAALQPSVAAVALGRTLDLYLVASEGLVTMEYSRWPESKGLRGLMKMDERKPHPDGFQLTYSAKWGQLDQKGVLAEWLRTEQRWQKARAKEGGK